MPPAGPDINSDTLDFIREVILDPVSGLSSRLLVVEGSLSALSAKQDAILMGLNGDGNTKGLMEIVRELQSESATTAKNRKFLKQDVLWRGVGMTALFIIGSIIVKHYTGW